MSEPDIKIYLHDGRKMVIRRWYSEGGLILNINHKDTVAANDEDSRRYLMERVIKALREDAYRLMHPEEESEEE